MGEGGVQFIEWVPSSSVRKVQTKVTAVTPAVELRGLAHEQIMLRTLSSLP